MNPPLYHSDLPSLTLLGRGKVRDLYAIDAERMLIVTTDRLSAFDVVLPTPIPGKGEVLTRMSSFWFNQLADILPSQLTGIDPATVVASDAERAQVAGRALVVKRLQPLPIEAIVRGYLAGSGWKDYQATGAVCGVALPAGLSQAEQLPEPIFTPSTKPADGSHDENISFATAAALIGDALAQEVRDKALAIYRRAASWAAARGILVADTKFEFGVDAQGRLHWIDEALTPDSSRFWPADQYAVGSNPPSFDKQFVRDWLESIHWTKQPPAPDVPADIIARTSAKYQEALTRLTGQTLA